MCLAVLNCKRLEISGEWLVRETAIYKWLKVISICGPISKKKLFPGFIGFLDFFFETRKPENLQENTFIYDLHHIVILWPHHSYPIQRLVNINNIYFPITAPQPHMNIKRNNNYFKPILCS